MAIKSFFKNPSSRHKAPPSLKEYVDQRLAKGASRENIQKELFADLEINGELEPNVYFRWSACLIKLDPVCPDCLERNGQIKTLEEWKKLGLPRSGKTRCNQECQCMLLPEKTPAREKKIKPKLILSIFAGIIVIIFIYLVLLNVRYRPTSNGKAFFDKQTGKYYVPYDAKYRPMSNGEVFFDKQTGKYFMPLDARYRPMSNGEVFFDRQTGKYVMPKDNAGTSLMPKSWMPKRVKPVTAYPEVEEVPPTNLQKNELDKLIRGEQQ